jgi:hypothetical protein
VTSSDPQLLKDVSVRWSLGNADTKDGADVFYTYDHPGSYVATLMTRGRKNVSDQITVNVSSSNIRIADTANGAEGFIKIENDLDRDVDLSGWHLRANGKTATLPAYTIALADQTLTIDNQATELTDTTQVELLYPDGTVAGSFQPEQTPAESSDESTRTSQPQENTTSHDTESSSGIGAATDPADDRQSLDQGETATTTSSTNTDATNLNDLFATGSQSAAAGRADPNGSFWRFGLLTAVLILAAVGVAAGLEIYGSGRRQRDLLSDTFDINEM